MTEIFNNGTEQERQKIIDIHYIIGVIDKDITFSLLVVNKLNIIKDKKTQKYKKKLDVEKIIIEHFNEHGAKCHFYLQKTLLDYVIHPENFERGVIHEIVGKQMRKCGCHID